MAWRCQDCDYYGEEIIWNETEEIHECPDCGYECNEICEMTEEQDRILKSFYENGDFIIEPGKESEAAPYKFLWEDFEALKQYLDLHKNDSIYMYTLIDCEDEEAWISEGKWHINRIGYFLSRIKIEIPEEGIRYW